MQDGALATAGVEKLTSQPAQRTVQSGTRRVFLFIVPAVLLVGWFVTTEITHSFLPN